MNYKRLKLCNKSKCNNKNIMHNIKNMKNVISTNGITLISLVITIIILIILSGIIINLSLEKNGLLTRTKQAKNQMERASIIEKIQTEIIDKQIENEEKILSDNELESILLKYGELVKDEKSKIISIKVKEKYEIELKEIIGNNKVEIAEEENSLPPYNTPYIPTGFKHIGEEGWNAGYTIIGDGEGIAPDEFVWVPCLLTEEQQNKAKENGDNVEIFKKTTTGKYNSNSLELLPTNTSVLKEDDSVKEIEKSVGKYGGFYIAKYEAGIDEEGEAYNNDELEEAKPIDGTYKPQSQDSRGVWNNIARCDAITVSKAMIDFNKTGAHSTLISGAAWDTTLQWIVKSSDNYLENTNWDEYSLGGWYHTYENSGVLSTGNYSKNNIFDFAGNAWEWTTENGISCYEEDDKIVESQVCVLRGRRIRNYKPRRMLGIIISRCI